MAGQRILVAEDESDIAEVLRYNLTREGFEVEVCERGDNALEAIRTSPPALVLLDLQLPGLNGLDLMKIVRRDQQLADLPVIMVTAKGEEVDRIVGLELGADDYITKPFSPRILIARTRAIVRRSTSEVPDETAIIRVHDVEIHPGRRTVTIQDRPVNLTYTEFQVLSILARRPGWVFTRSQIVDMVRGDDYPVTDRSVDVQIVGLRKKLGNHGELIETVRGVGYRFKEAP